MDESDRVFSHQQQIVLELAQTWEEVHVITGRVGGFSPTQNIHVYDSKWARGQGTRNVFRFLRLFFRVSSSNEFVAIFSHMTEVQSALVAPFCWIKKRKHFLWYAHASNSKWLRFVSLFATGIITSTSGSCPLKGSNVIPIGQSVNEKQFAFRESEGKNLLKILHFGRLDKSKGIRELIETVASLRTTDAELSLTLIGNPSNLENLQWANELKKLYGAESSWLSFQPGVNRNELPGIIGSYDVMLHAFQGSLDKTLLEATMVGLPVVTINREYLKQFGSWGPNVDLISLENELIALLELDSHTLNSRLRMRRESAVQNHSISSWITRLNQILRS